MKDESIAQVCAHPMVALTVGRLLGPAHLRARSRGMLVCIASSGTTHCKCTWHLGAGTELIPNELDTGDLGAYIVFVFLLLSMICITQS